MADFEALVAGDAAITFSWQVSAAPTPGRTSKLLGPVEPEARFGGCAPGVALALAGLGHRVALVSWLGDDSHGRSYLNELRAHGVDITGVEVAAGQASPRALMLYDPTGSATCLHHPSGSGSLRLPPAGRDRLEESRWLALTAGPAPMSEALLDARPHDTLVAWDVKADPRHYSVELRRRIVRAAHLLCFNRDEVAFLAEAFDDGPVGSPDEQLEKLRQSTSAILVMTDGPAGCRVMDSQGVAAIPASRVEVDDPTGVGDAFFAAFLSATIRRLDPREAGIYATSQATEFLQRRKDLPATTIGKESAS